MVSKLQALAMLCGKSSGDITHQQQDRAQKQQRYSSQELINRPNMPCGCSSYFTEAERPRKKTPDRPPAKL